MQQLTYRQQRILTAIRNYTELMGYPPSVREIQQTCGLKSTSAVAYQLQQIEAKGWIQRAPGRARALVILDPQGAAAA